MRFIAACGKCSNRVSEHPLGQLLRGVMIPRGLSEKEPEHLPLMTAERGFREPGRVRVNGERLAVRGTQVATVPEETLWLTRSFTQDLFSG